MKAAWLYMIGIAIESAFWKMKGGGLTVNMKKGQVFSSTLAAEGRPASA